MRICRKCGTLVTKSMGVCPKCSTAELGNAEASTASLSMSEEELKRARIKSWIWIIIGVPGLIGIIYLLTYVMSLLKT